ncbi:MAG: DUF262 domain-containing HNH endonuclease family protein [Planctomycetaceae bacterium]|jgi:hypothetical protein|nr:DUF262 domain-containing HNH endonuclease family protein [Planctomycetaceae bacterium]
MLKPRAIGDILGYNFFIPSYQRGFRWTKQQVEDLLNDIYSFAKSQDEFYCLQPVVVRKCTDAVKSQNNLESDNGDDVWYEVVDGQQRLTTIRIILEYLVKDHLNGKSLEAEYKKPVFALEYETRRETKEFLSRIASVQESDIKGIDFDFIFHAYQHIVGWFKRQEKPRSVRESILRTLVHTMKDKEHEGVVQIIWYEIDDTENPIDTFIRINMGKIPLTNAELIKALFLQKKNFGNDTIAEKRQEEIALTWDRIEYALQDENFWWFLNKDRNDTPARIEFVFDFMYNIACSKEPSRDEEKAKKFDEKYGTDTYKTFRFFNEKFTDVNIETVEKEWNAIEGCFHTFEEWYNNPVWYHYIGFLVFCGISLSEVYGFYDGKRKIEFTNNLRAKIKAQINISAEKQEIVQENKNLTPCYKYNIDVTYDKNKKKVHELLLLYNLEYIVKQYSDILNDAIENREIIIKFPFKLFKTEKWDVEHIDSYTQNSINDRKTQEEWIKSARIDIQKELKEKLDIDNNIDLFLQNDEAAQRFDDLKNSIIKLAGELGEENDEATKNSIGNLTLLNADINRGYGNALFPTKRRIIIRKDGAGKFIPLCTKNVFLKYFDKEGAGLNTRWNNDDIKKYQNDIGFVLECFLNITLVNATGEENE